jgi:hypothetical protein
VKPAALFAFNDKFREIGFARRALSRLRDQLPTLEAAINFGSMLDPVNTHRFLRVINPIKDAPVTYP